jgi:hypothetical protein
MTPAERAPVLHPIPELKPARGAPVEAAAEMSDSGVLAVLEQGSGARRPRRRLR